MTSRKTALHLFGEALELEREQRLELLDRLEREDTQLFRELTAMLADHEALEAAGFMNTADVFAQVLEAQPDEGDKVGPYQLIRRLGEGGMGRVFLADQQEPVERQVALKIMHAGITDRHMLLRFRNECRLLAFLNHNYIARIFDSGTTSQGQPWLTMEYVSGLPSDKFCREHALDLHQRLALFSKICLAVHHAHQKGVIHRDLKPPNILVCMENGEPIPKVIDFGIARMTAPALAQTILTHQGHFIGTPAYMSPEQALGLEDIDTRSDIYALGVLLYQMLTEQLPHPMQGLAPDRQLGLLTGADVERPSARLLRMGASGSNQKKQARELAGDLDWIVLRALAKDRTKRYGTAIELYKEIQRFRNNEPVSARGPSPIYRLNKFIRRHRIWLAAIVLIIMALTIGSIVAVQGRTQALSARKIAEAEAAKARETLEMFQELLMTPQRGGHRHDARLQDLLAPFVAELNNGKTLNEGVELELRRIIARTYTNFGENQLARPQFKRALELQRFIQGHRHPETLKLMIQTAINLSELERRDEAWDLVKKAHRTALDELGPGHPITLRAKVRLAHFTAEDGDPQTANQLARRASEDALAFLGEEHEIAISAFEILGLTNISLGRQGEGLAYLEKTLKLSQRVHGPFDPYTLKVTFNNIVVRGPEAITSLDQLTDLYDNANGVLGPVHSMTLLTGSLIAAMQISSGNPQAAAELMDQQLNLIESEIGLEHPRFLGHMLLAAWSRYEMGNMQEAVAWLECLMNKVKSSPLNPGLLLSGRLSLARIFMETGHMEQAWPILEAVSELEADIPVEHEIRVIALAMSMEWYELQGDESSARRVLQKALVAGQACYQRPEAGARIEVFGQYTNNYYAEILDRAAGL